MSAFTLSFVCAWCERVRTSAGGWVQSDADPIAHATHGICPECLVAQTRAVMALPPQGSIPPDARPPL